MQSFEAFGRVQKPDLQQEDDDVEPDCERVLDRRHRVAKWWIREQQAAIGRPLGHLEEVPHERVRATAIANVGRMHLDPSRAHREGKVAPTAEWLTHTRHAGEEWFMLE